MKWGQFDAIAYARMAYACSPSSESAEQQQCSMEKVVEGQQLVQ
jgi:hypothetical protein